MVVGTVRDGQTDGLAIVGDRIVDDLNQETDRCESLCPRREDECPGPVTVVGARNPVVHSPG